MNDTQSLIIQLLRQHGGMTRGQISRHLGLSPMGTSKPLAALQRAGMVTLGRKAQDGPGRPSKSVDLATDGCFAIGVSIKHLEVEAAVVNLQNQVIDFQSMPFSFAGGITDFSPVFDLVAKMIKPLPRQARFAAGLSLSGDFEFDSERILKTTDFTSVEQAELFRRQLDKKLGIAVRLIHDPEACLIAERWNNPSLPPNPTLLHIGDRLGFALMIDGHLCRGTPQWTRWLGRQQVPGSDHQTPGFLSGALVGTATIHAWINRLDGSYYGARPYFSPEMQREKIARFYEAWKRNEPAARALVQQGAQDMARLVRNLCMLLPFQRVICSGWTPEVREYIITEIRRAVDEIQAAHRIPVPECTPIIAATQLSEKSEAAGAAMWSIDRTLELKLARRGWSRPARKRG